MWIREAVESQLTESNTLNGVTHRFTTRRPVELVGSQLVEQTNSSKLQMDKHVEPQLIESHLIKQTKQVGLG